MKINLQLSVALPEHLQDAEVFFRRLASPAVTLENADLRVEAIRWEKLWHFIQTKSLSKSGIDVSEVGTTWLGSLVDANALRPITPTELEQIGGAKVFSPSSFEGVSLVGDNRILSIPWLTDTRVIYYWKDLLESAHVDENLAFSTTESTERTMDALRREGIPAWGVATFACNNTVHQAASWLWAAGKNYVSEDGKRTEFSDSAAIRAIHDYFKLYQYMPCAFNSLDDLGNAFQTRKVACVMDGPWLLTRLLKSAEAPRVAESLGLALPPGAPFVGGSNLVIWNYVSDETVNAALSLIKRLISVDVQSKVAQEIGLLPVRQELLDMRPFNANPHYGVLRQAEREGRRLPRITTWGPLEVSLVNAFSMIWQRIKERGFNEVDDTIRKHLEPLAKRFDRLLEIYDR